jgi:hypothetical protein
MSSKELPVIGNLDWKKALAFGTGALLTGYCLYSYFSSKPIDLSKLRPVVEQIKSEEIELCLEPTSSAFRSESNFVVINRGVILSTILRKRKRTGIFSFEKKRCIK